ncbi:MAG: hypothetical protein IT363_02045 [Methanoregulaceae archaeon]|jgi:flagellar basal-body rod modification protein FlgD|nr:hypothetical protein [Methanoregulaceae archaeon]
MNINPINSLPTKAGGSSTPGSTLDMETFLVLLTVQLATQNPLEPMSDRDFFAQMAQLGTVQGMDAMRGSLDASQAANMIGKKVTAIRPFTVVGNETSPLVEGKVERVIIRDGRNYLVVREANDGLVEVEMGNVLQIQEATAAATQS